MANSATLAIKIVTDATNAARGLDATAGKASKFQSGLSKMIGPALAVGAGVALIGAKALQSASDLQQAQGAVETVFGKSAQAVKDFSATADTRMGLAAAAYQNYAALVGSALQNAGFSQSESVEKADSIMQRAADMAATFGGTTSEAVEAINAAVARSEFDPLEKYGVALNQTAVNAELAARGQDDLTGKALANAKATIALEAIYDKTAKTQGQFARESDSAAGASQIAQASFENAAAALGTALLPAAAKTATMLARLATFLGKHKTATTIAIVAIGAMAAAILALNIAMSIYTAVTTLAGSATIVAWAAAIWPILAVVAAVALVVGAVVLLWKKSETFRSIVLAVWGAIRKVAVATGTAIRSAFVRAVTSVVSIFQRARAVWSAVVGAIRSAAQAVASAIASRWKAMVAALVGAAQSLRSKVAAVWSAIRSAIGLVVSKASDLIAKIKNITVPGAIKTAIDAIKRALDSVISAVKSLIDWIKDIPIPHIDWPKPPSWLPGVGKAAPAPAVAQRALLGARGGLLAPIVPSRAAVGGGGAGMIVINVTGAIDPEGTARTIKRVLAQHERRIGGRPA